MAVALGSKRKDHEFDQIASYGALIDVDFAISKHEGFHVYIQLSCLFFLSSILWIRLLHIKVNTLVIGHDR